MAFRHSRSRLTFFAAMGVVAIGACAERPAAAPDASSATAPPAVQDRAEYRPNLTIINDQSHRTYSTLAESKFKYRDALRNDYDYYANHATKAPAGFDGSALLSDNVLVLYQSKRHPDRPADAMILVHGNSSSPDGFFVDDGYYLNNAGSFAYEQGFDVFAPYVTHNSRFQNARRRLAAMQGDGPDELDLRRIELLLDEIAPQYERIHLAGCSYGGALVVKTLHRAISRADDTADKLGMVLSIEGWISARRLIELDESRLFEWNWEMVFPGVPDALFSAMLDDPRVFVAYSNAWEDTYAPAYENADPARVVRFDGGHEFSLDALAEATRRYADAVR